MKLRQQIDLTSATASVETSASKSVRFIKKKNDNYLCVKKFSKNVNDFIKRECNKINLLKDMAKCTKYTRYAYENTCTPCTLHEQYVSYLNEEVDEKMNADEIILWVKCGFIVLVSPSIQNIC